MKETKVYVNGLPKSCSECEWCTLNHKDNYSRPFCLIARMPLYNGDRVNEERGQNKDSLSDFDCPLIDIKTHDRTLVKEVCEKIRDYLLDKCDFDYGYYINDGDFSVPDLWYFLDQIQKLEGEDE